MEHTVSNFQPNFQVLKLIALYFMFLVSTGLTRDNIS